MDKSAINRDEKLFNKLTDNARKVIVLSYDLARKDNKNLSNEIQAKHLFVGILLTKTTLAAKILERFNVDLVQTADALMGQLSPIYIIKDVLPSSDYKKVLGQAFMESAQLGHVYVGTEHILLAMLKMQKYDFIGDLEKSDISYDRVKQEIQQFGSYQPGVFGRPGAENIEDFSMNEEEHLDENPTLEKFGKSMVESARVGKYLPIFGREEEVERVLHILSRQTKNNPILIGEPGVGKTAVVEGLAQRIVNGKVPHTFKDADIIQLDIASIIAGAKVRGDVEERLLAIIDEAKKSPNTILFIDEIHMVVGMSNSPSGSDVVNLLKPHLTSGELQVIGATTYDEYRKYFEEEGALNRRFQPVPIEELDTEAAIKVLEYLRPGFEKYHNVMITNESLKEAVKLSQRYVLDRFLPDKAIDLIDEAAAKKKLQRVSKDTKTGVIQKNITNVAEQKAEALRTGDVEEAGRLRQKELTLREELQAYSKKTGKKSSRYKVEPEDIRGIISQWTKIPVTSMSVTDLKTISRMEKLMAKRIIGQNDAINRVAAALQRAKLGIADEKKPLATFMFLGPTGVGKTETAKVISRELFGAEDNMIQVNMSEFMEAHTVSKILGAPPGYVGYSDGNHLTERVRKNPYTVVLFDEIEKAHPDVLNILLQVLDEGELQDSKGRTVNFRNCVIILTSNIGAEEIAEDDVLGFDVNFADQKKKEKVEAYDQMRTSIMSELKQYLRPELINRLDDIIVFRGLDEDDALEIAAIQLSELSDRLKDRHIALKIQKAVEKKIAEDGFSKEYGARNIRRKVQEMIENKLAQFLLEEGLVEELAKREKQKLPNVLVTVGSNKSGGVKFRRG